MSDTKFAPYIFFKGNCRQAIEFYKAIFGGEVSFQTYKESGQNAAGMEDKIMHASLITSNFKLYGSDTEKASDKVAKVSFCLEGTDEAELKRYFEGLSQGGNVTSPLKKEFWGDTFGSVTDQFFIDWMVNISASPSS